MTKPLDAIYSVLIQPVRSQLGKSSGSYQHFKSSRAKHLKYIKTTTGDLRNRFIHLSLGWVDCYQFVIVYDSL